MKNRVYILFVFYLVSVNYLFSQNINAASTQPLQDGKNCLQTALLNIEKFGKPDSALLYAERAQINFKKINDQKNFRKARLYYAIGCQQKNRFDTSIVILEQILNELHGQNDSLEADVYFNLGINNYRAGDKKKALEFFIEAVPLYQKIQNNDGLVLTYCKLADVLVTDSQNKEANAYKNKAVALLTKVKGAFSKIFAHNLISRIYMDLRSESPTYIDSSIFYAKEAYALIKKFDYTTRAFQILNIISDNYFIKGQYEIGIQYCKESLKYRKSLYPGEMILFYLKFCDYYDIKGQYKVALTYLDSVKGQLSQINVQYYWMLYYQRTYEINKKANRPLEAIAAIEHYNNLKDSLYNVDKSKEINELVQKYDRIENEKKILELSKEKEIAAINTKLLIAGVAASLFAIIIIVFFYRQTNIKNKLKIIETEQRLNRARMDPHFFFNILSSLRAFAQSENDNSKIADYLTKYSKIMRQSLESTYNELITVETEIDFLKNYFEIQTLRYPQRFDYEIRLSDKLESDELMIPSMIIQPFVENAIEHGFSENHTKGLIWVSVEIESCELSITIGDNGLGISNVEGEQKSYPSRATQIVRDRLFLLNKKYKAHARFEINKKLGSGIEVRIFLPLLYSN